MTENELSFVARGAIFTVFKTLGPGLLESVYESALTEELIRRRVGVRRQVPIPVYYGETTLDVGFRLDLLLDDKVIIEIKSVDSLTSVHHKQIITYLRLSGIKLGLLVNFNTTDVSKTIFRKVNGL
ncbi:MAG: GxxExxY protein [Bacteroidetes bacterium]|nr:GxxExxY protein [Bacteroidota bacterium]